jgi:hypothetical protein
MAISTLRQSATIALWHPHRKPPPLQWQKLDQNEPALDSTAEQVAHREKDQNDTFQNSTAEQGAKESKPDNQVLISDTATAEQVAHQARGQNLKMRV